MYVSKQKEQPEIRDPEFQANNYHDYMYNVKTKSTKCRPLHRGDETEYIKIISKNSVVFR